MKKSFLAFCFVFISIVSKAGINKTGSDGFVADCLESLIPSYKRNLAGAK